MPFARRQITRFAPPFFLAIAVASHACQVPVFRYALERWDASPYLLTITPGKDGLTKAEKAVLDEFRESSQHPSAPLNVEIQTEAPRTSAKEATMSLRYPAKLRDALPKAVWEAPLTQANTRRLHSSPVRQELQKRLLAGESAVWLLLESGDAVKDDAVARILEQGMAAARETLRLPDRAVPQDQASRPKYGRQESADVLHSDPPLKIQFSVLHVKRQDIGEAALISTLMHLEDDLGEFIREPMAFPVFGRGRVLEPLIGAGVTTDNILEQSGYLCGACSCEVKDLNPGIDLLLAANWSPVDTTPVLETVRINPSGETPPAKSANAVPITAGTAVLALVAWMFWRKCAAA